MNTRLIKTIEKLNKEHRGGQHFIDAYNNNYSDEVSGTILTGIDFRCMHFIIEYERETLQDNRE